MSAVRARRRAEEHHEIPDKFRICGGKKLRGTVEIRGGKNAALAVLAAALLSDEPVTIENVPQIEDVSLMVHMFRELGARVLWTGRTMTIDAADFTPDERVTEQYARSMRASYYLFGAMLGKFCRGQMPFPGGCDIGSRPIEQHIKGFEALGAAVENEHGWLMGKSLGLKGTEVYLDVPSVGATINILLASCRASGLTTIVNAGKEPHIVDVANFINAMGGSVKGAGTDVIRVKGVPSLHGCTYTIIPDQIVTGTLMIAAAATLGDVTIKGAIPTHMEALTAKLLEMGARVEEGVGEDSIRIWSDGDHRHVNIKTLPYPGFPTDLQQPISALLTTARGISVINETIYEMRFKHLEEIMRMGAKVRLNDRLAMIEGVDKLSGCSVSANDMRAGAALVIAGLMADGVTTVDNIHFVDRGYEGLEQKLRSLGADIERVL